MMIFVVSVIHDETYQTLALCLSWGRSIEGLYPMVTHAGIAWAFFLIERITECNIRVIHHNVLMFRHQCIVYKSCLQPDVRIIPMIKVKSR